MLIKIYNYFKEHKKVMWASLLTLSVTFFALLFSLQYSENIMDFLPMETAEREALDVYQNISGSDKIILLFENNDTEMVVEAMDLFTSTVEEKDKEGLYSSLYENPDVSNITQLMDFVYENIPYFLQDEDYERIDSLLSKPGYIRSRLLQNKQSLMMSSGGFATSIRHDPLDLFSPVLNKMTQANPQIGFQMIDGYIFTPDMSRAIMIMKSPFGGSETENNTKLIRLLNDAANQVMSEYPEIRVNITGGPVIAVENSTRIKKDSIIAISISMVLIVLLLIYSFHSLRNILLILLSIGWGWIFAMGSMSLFNDGVSIIVIGISSVIIGIAVNYPLHLIIHTQEQTDFRIALKEVAFPLLVGNVTTIGAFLSLVPLQSVALKDLGLFASLLLLGTILFVLIYLPHFVKTGSIKKRKNRIIESIASWSPHKNRFVILSTVVITLVLGYFSTKNTFNSNMSDINYMTKEQRSEMHYFQSLFASSAKKNTTDLYIISSGKDYDEALVEAEKNTSKMGSLLKDGTILNYKGVAPFLSTLDQQQERMDKWRKFALSFNDEYSGLLMTEAVDCGFTKTAFTPFLSLFDSSRSFEPKEVEYFAPLVSTILPTNLTSLEATGKSYIIDVITVNIDAKERVMGEFEKCFDITEINSSITKNLSANFNYLTLVCSLIVFFFLWISFGRLEIAVITFLPMAFSWMWILGIMSLLGIQFNIVNIILATFIFGQGDDYTIFMTEGCQYEYAHNRPILKSYKVSIVQSALIMFVGIGTLIVAKHPALRSLAEVTIIGMASVILMAYLIPPFLFTWLTTKNGKRRKHPITLATILTGYPSDYRKQVYGRYIYKGFGICRSVKRSLKQNADTIINTQPTDGIIRITDNGYGELAILAALSHPDAKVTAIIDDEERQNIAAVAAADFIDNIEFKKS